MPWRSREDGRRYGHEGWDDWNTDRENWKASTWGKDTKSEANGKVANGHAQTAAERFAVLAPSAEKTRRKDWESTRREGPKRHAPERGDGPSTSATAPVNPPLLQLPIDEFRDRILRHIRENRVTHIQGETGCGKSTRLPQFILEDAQERGEEIRMVVTQPRRMAAVTLARRVASVLGEDIGQGTVGYRISGDTIDGKLCFVTVGYLLQRLVNNPEDFDRYTHVVLDEVHERGVDADLLSMVIKLLMHCCPTVKLIVMSATLQASLFADYFSSLQRNRKASEVLAVGARCHPVEQLFLDDLEEQFDFAESRDRRSLDNALEAFRSLSKGKGKGKSKGGDDTGFKRVEPQISDGLMEVTCSLVQQLAKPGCTVIVFLPGIADITTLFENLAPLDDARELTRAGVIKRADCPRLRIFALHSMIPRQEQEEVFNEVPEDCSHIVLASNIAESSLTLPNVCAVVDLALRRSVQYDTRRLMCCLVTTWCSQSSCKQRRGRAGRTMPGRAVCLVPRRFFEKQLPLFDPPEMLNAPLTKLYLQAKQLCSTLTRVADRVHLPPEVHMDVSAPKALLQEVVQPPSLELLDAAIWELAAVGCLTTAEEDADITPLGQIAIALPCDLRICRLLFLGCLFRCPADALAMAAGLTAPDPFSAPSLLVLKDQREYVQKLDRSFAARRWCDHGTFSEPIMMHSLFVEWIRAGAPRGVKALGSFVRDWSIIPKKFESLTTDATDLTVRFLKLLKPGAARSNLEELLAAMHHKIDRGDDLLRVTGRGRVERIFTGDVDKLRSLVALAFSDQMLLHLNPRWACGGPKKKQEEQLLDLMLKNSLDPHNTVGIFVPTGEDEDSISELAANMCGEQPEQVLVIEKAKMALVSFQHTAEQDALDHDDVLLWDVPSSIHRLHMFGSGRYRFFVERSDKEPVELFKPIHPFMLQWDVLTHPGGSVNNKKKPPTVKGMCDWRNPLGFACHVDETLPPTEFVGCCASVQGLEGGAQAFVAGSTVLPLRFLPLLLTTLCPERWALNWAVDQNGEVWGVRILHHELVNLPAKTLAPEVLEAINFLRVQLQEALYPASWWDEWNEPWNESGARHARGPKDRDDLVETPDLSESLQSLLQMLPQAHGKLLQHPKKLRWRPAATFSEEWDDDSLRPLQPLSTGEDGSEEIGSKEFKNVIEYLTAHGECLVKDLPKSMQKNKKQFGKRPDLFELQQTKKGSLLVRLAGAPATKKNGNQGQRGSARAHGREKPLVDAIIRLLKGRKEGGPMGLGELGSQEHVKDLLTQQKVQLQKIKPFLQAFPSVFEMGEDGHGQLAVQLCGGGFDFKSVPKSRSTKGAHPGSGRRKGGSLVTEHITSLCSQSPALAADFDGRVKGLLQDIQEKEGADGLDECFDMLHEWLSKKEERSSINNWTAYIMKLLRNWNQME
ncbi:unnamed protein product [Durusdinium trenchii]|uniref:RNA helicase n=1 Tax=Durusdinium trenchii TaxID=1381693 RepID=A0ABP0IGV4_9DINO